jgi:hypothetical protein
LGVGRQLFDFGLEALQNTQPGCRGYSCLRGKEIVKMAPVLLGETAVTYP